MIVITIEELWKKNTQMLMRLKICISDDDVPLKFSRKSHVSITPHLLYRKCDMYEHV